VERGHEGDDEKGHSLFEAHGVRAKDPKLPSVTRIGDVRKIYIHGLPKSRKGGAE